MIVATKDGWLIAAELITENNSQVIVKPFDTQQPITINKNDARQKVFNSVNEAMTWVFATERKSEGIGQ